MIWLVCFILYYAKYYRACLGPRRGVRAVRNWYCRGLPPAAQETRVLVHFCGGCVSCGENNRRLLNGVWWDYFDSRGGAAADQIIS